MVAAFAYNRVPSGAGGIAVIRPRLTAGIYILAIATALMMGLRFEVGGDWFAYLANYNSIQLLSYSQALETFDVAYATLVFVAGRLDTGMWLVNLCCALIMTFGIVRFCSRQPNPALSFLVGIPYLLIVVGMGYTRQGVAIGLILAGIADADERSIVKVVLFFLAAALFHRTALLVLPLALAPFLRRNPLYAIAGALVFAVLFVVLLRDTADQLVTNYVDADYESGGAAVRVAMNFVPALLALTLRRRLGFNAYQSDMWSVFAIVGLATLPLVLAASFTTAIDRLALFLIPLQIAILPRLPYIFGKGKRLNAQFMMIVIGYSAAVQLVWLVFATHASYWVPYRAYILRADETSRADRRETP